MREENESGRLDNVLGIGIFVAFLLGVVWYGSKAVLSLPPIYIVPVVGVGVLYVTLRFQLIGEPKSERTGLIPMMVMLVGLCWLCLWPFTVRYFRDVGEEVLVIIVAMVGGSMMAIGIQGEGR